MDGRQRAIQLHDLTQFRQGQIRLPRQVQLHLLLVGGKNAWLGTRKAVARGNVARSPALLQELLDQAEGDSITAGDFLAGAVLLVVRGQNALPQIQ